MFRATDSYWKMEFSEYEFDRVGCKNRVKTLKVVVNTGIWVKCKQELTRWSPSEHFLPFSVLSSLCLQHPTR